MYIWPKVHRFASFPFSSSQLSRPYVVAAACLSPPTSRQLSAQIELPPSQIGFCLGSRHRRPTPGAKAFADLFAGEERPAGIPNLTPLLFPVSCAKPSSQTTSSYLAIRFLVTFCKSHWCACTPVPLLIRPCSVSTSPLVICLHVIAEMNVAVPPQSPHLRLYDFAKSAIIKIFAFPYATVCYMLLSFMIFSSFQISEKLRRNPESNFTFIGCQMPKVCDLYCDGGMDTDKWCDAQVGHYIGIGRLPFTSLSPL
jgi:hypothetical protein